MKHNRSGIDVRTDDMEVWGAVTTSSRDDLWLALLTSASSQLTLEVWNFTSSGVWEGVGDMVAPAVWRLQKRASDEFFKN